MKPAFSFARLVFVLASIAFFIGVAAFSQAKKGNKESIQKAPGSAGNDTSKSRNKNINIDTDALNIQMKQLDVEMKKLDMEMKKLDVTIDKEVNQAIKNIDFDKINVDINKSLENLDVDEINQEINENMEKMEKLDLTEFNKDMAKVKVDLDKQKVELKEQLERIDVDKIKAEAKNAMKGAKQSMLKAKEELKQTQQFINALQKDGLIDKKKAFKIEVKDGRLFINGKEQSKEVSDKYKKFYRSNNFTIDMNANDDFRI